MAAEVSETQSHSFRLASAIGQTDDHVTKTSQSAGCLIIFDRLRGRASHGLLDRNERIIILVLTTMQLITGALLLLLTSLLHVTLNRNHNNGHPPPLWWTALTPLLVGTSGMACAARGCRHKVLLWGVGSLLLLLIHTCLMSGLGNFWPRMYDVWPLLPAHRLGHPLCQPMVDRCYCQLYYDNERSGQQLIHEDVLWVETGFMSCNDVTYTSVLYYCAMSTLALFAFASLFGCGLVLSYSACAKSMLQFHRLQEEDDRLWELIPQTEASGACATV